VVGEEHFKMCVVISLLIYFYIFITYTEVCIIDILQKALPSYVTSATSWQTSLRELWNNRDFKKIFVKICGNPDFAKFPLETT